VTAKNLEAWIIITVDKSMPSSDVLLASGVGALLGILLCVLIFLVCLRWGVIETLQYRALLAKRPKRIILIRHGESEGNVDSTKYATVPDNKVGEFLWQQSRRRRRPETRLPLYHHLPGSLINCCSLAD
jgi:hypothetical protein